MAQKVLGNLNKRPRGSLSGQRKTKKDQSIRGLNIQSAYLCIAYGILIFHML